MLRARLADNQQQQADDLKRAATIDSKEWRYGIHLGRTLSRQGKSAEAVKSLKKYYDAQAGNRNADEGG